MLGSGDSSGAFAALLEHIAATSQSAQHAPVCADAFARLAFYFEKVYSIFKEVLEAPQTRASALQSSVHSLETEVKRASELLSFCATKSRFYLVLNCRASTRLVEDIIKKLGGAVYELSVNSVEIPLRLKNKLKMLCQEMDDVQLKITVAEEDLVDRVEMSLRDQYSGSDHANEVLFKMAKVTCVSLDPMSLKSEFEKLKKDVEMLALDKGQTGVAQLEQVVSLLSSADALGCVTEREKQYRQRRLGLTSNFLPPLQTFICPITQDVMENPVEIATGQTFEMSAIQKWFAEGHNVCPITKIELKSLSLKPNRLLKQSIEEWKDRNTVIKLTGMPSRLKSEKEEEVTDALLEIQELCDEKSMHKYWIAAEGLIPILVGLLGSSKRDIRKKTLATLIIVLSDNSENRTKFCNAGGVKYAVHSLARDAGEARQAVALLLELSKEEGIPEQISKVQGCILLLVTMANSENTHAAADAEVLLKLLAMSNDNIMLMAEVNYFKPLVQCLHEGSHITQVLMANTLSRMQLTDQSRALLVQEGVLAPLVQMASQGDMGSKSASLGAFRNLSMLPENRDSMIEAGVMKPLLDILFTLKSVVATVREHAAATFANLALSSQSCGIGEFWGNLNDAEEAIPQLISVLNFTGPNIQSHILRALSSICLHPASKIVRGILREIDGVQMFLRFVDAGKDPEVRLHALKLLWNLTKDGGDVLAAEMDIASFQNLVHVFSLEALEEEKVAAMGILGNLPINNRQITEWMLQAGLFTSIVSILEMACSRNTRKVNTALVENAMLTLIRFTLPTDVSLQAFTAEHGIISLLVNLLSFGTGVCKCRAALSLQQLSESTIKLSVPVKSRDGWCCLRSPPQPTCAVHSGTCSMKDTFCLLEAEAIPPLIQALDERNDELDEAVLSALATFLYDECWQKGSDMMVQAGAVLLIIRKLNTGSPDVQERALWILERIFRKEKYRAQFGSVAQMPLVSLTQSGTNATRPLAAKILAHLNILHDQSSYF